MKILSVRYAPLFALTILCSCSDHGQKDEVIFTGYAMVSPIDGSSSVEVDGKSFSIYTDKDNFSKLLEKASSSPYKYFFIPMIIKAKYTYPPNYKEKKIHISSIYYVKAIEGEEEIKKIYERYGMIPMKIDE